MTLITAKSNFNCVRWNAVVPAKYKKHRGFMYRNEDWSESKSLLCDQRWKPNLALHTCTTQQAQTNGQLLNNSRQWNTTSGLPSSSVTIVNYCACNEDSAQEPINAKHRPRSSNCINACNFFIKCSVKSLTLDGRKGLHNRDAQLNKTWTSLPLHRHLRFDGTLGQTNK